MKYEFIFKIKEDHQWIIKYRCVAPERKFQTMKAAYEKLEATHPEWKSLILINKLDDNNEFLEIIQ